MEKNSPCPPDAQELLRAVNAITPVGEIDGHDVIRRSSAVEIVRSREWRLTCAQERIAAQSKQISKLKRLLRDLYPHAPPEFRQALVDAVCE